VEFINNENLPSADRTKSAVLSVGGHHPVRSARARWGNREELFSDGFLTVPHKFLTCYAWLRPEPLTTGEAMFVLQLMTFKWEAAAPYPSYKTLAKRMRLSETMVRAYARSLSKKGYLVRHYQKRAPNRFDLNPLFAAIAQSWAPNDEVIAPSAKVVDVNEAEFNDLVWK
jgi:hypothetical protein